MVIDCVLLFYVVLCCVGLGSMPTSSPSWQIPGMATASPMTCHTGLGWLVGWLVGGLVSRLVE